LAVWGIARACRADIAAAWLDQGGGADTDAQDDDEDLKSDPIAQIDLAVSDLLSHFIDAVRNTPPDSCITRTVRPTSRIFRPKSVVALPQTNEELISSPGTPHRDAPTMLREQRQWDARDGRGAHRGGEGDPKRGVDALSGGTGMLV
jgi:hypothetical protein